MESNLLMDADNSTMLDTIDVELSGYCNANCIFCPRDKMIREKAILDKNIFDMLLKEVSLIRPSGPREIYLTGLGEPLHNKNIFIFAGSIRQYFPKTRISVTSNGALLTKELCDEILSSEINGFQCSIQSIHKDEYAKSMSITNFESIVYWITYLAQRKREFNIDISVSIVRTMQTDKEIEEYRQFWEKRIVNVSERKVHNRGGFLDNIMLREASANRIGCGLFNTRLFVAGNGDILACCHDLNGQSRFGTIGSDSLQSILARKHQIADEKKLFPMCAICNDSCGQY